MGVFPRFTLDMATHSFESDLFDKVAESELFHQFKEAFCTATGLPLRLVPSDSEWCVDQNVNQSPFCQVIKRCESACNACREVNRQLEGGSTGIEGPKTCDCFAGLCSTAVPVRLGKTTLGFLKTGQVFLRKPDEGDFSRIIAHLKKTGPLSSREEKGLHDAYFQTRELNPARYESMVTLLNLFAAQLSDFAEKAAVVIRKDEPPGIAAARLLIHRELEEPISLDRLARTANMSRSHFCRAFKEFTSMTVTTYITRARINWAKKELLKPSVQVSEVAYQVGFQSLSQFNRSFAKLVGMSPTAYRREEFSKVGQAG